MPGSFLVHYLALFNAYDFLILSIIHNSINGQLINKAWDLVDVVHY